MHRLIVASCVGSTDGDWTCTTEQVFCLSMKSLKPQLSLCWPLASLSQALKAAGN